MPSRMSSRRQNHALPKSKKNWKLMFLLLFLLGMFGIVFLYFWQPAQQISCVTNMNTYCDTSYDQDLEHLKQTSWIRVHRQYSAIESNIIASHQDVMAVHFQKRFPRNIDIEVIKAESLFVATIRDQHWQVYDNGYLKKIDKPTIPLFIFENKEVLKKLNDDQLSQLAYLYEKAINLVPRWKEIRFYANNQVEAQIENRGKVLLKIENN